MPYSTVNSLLQTTHPDLNAAEAHGIAAGMLCVNGQTTFAYWLNELLDQDQTLSVEASQLLGRLFEETRRLLASEEFEFTLLLPDDDELLSDRVLALKNWCQGFLFGTGCGQISRRLSKDAQDILKDISEFTKLDSCPSVHLVQCRIFRS